VEVKQIQFSTEFAVVPLLRFLDPFQMLVELLRREERRAVDALHRLALRVAFPIRIGRREQLERPQRPGGRHVRADAEVDERVAILDRVARDVGLALRLLLDQLHLERLAALLEKFKRFGARPHLTLVDQILRRQLAHLRFDAIEILRHERPIDDEVVEEPLVDDRADAALGAGEKRGDRRSHQMRGRVARDVERLGRLVRENLHARVGRELMRQIDDAIVDLCCQRGVGKTRRNVAGDLQDRCARFNLPDRTVRKRD
jgi:hypothetical protein